MMKYSKTFCTNHIKEML